MPGRFIDKEILLKYVQGTCDGQEEARVLQWLAEPGNEQAMLDFMNEQDGADWAVFMEPSSLPNSSKRWKKTIRQHIRSESEGSRNKWPGLLTKAIAIYLPVLGILGYVLYLFMASGLENRHSAIAQRKTENPRGQRSVIRLPDSSKVFLGPESKLTYPDKFTESRQVTLHGEAYFEIYRHSKLPFTVISNGMQAVVLGTSFKISSFSPHQFNVAVTSGKLKVLDQSGKQENVLGTLGAGEGLDYLRGRLSRERINIQQVDQWRQAQLSFDAQTLQQIFAELERWHKTTIVLNNPELANEKITVSIKATLPISRIMKLLAQAAKFNYKIESNRITVF